MFGFGGKAAVPPAGILRPEIAKGGLANPR